MAELIPAEYRLRIAQQQQVSRWISAGVFVALIAACGVAYVYGWDHQRSVEAEALRHTYAEKSALITRSQELRTDRRDLASRMTKIEQLMDDKVLLSLLQNISAGFSKSDCLDFIQIEAHNVDATSSGDKPGVSDNGAYILRINGITQNSTTLADLMSRLGKRSSPAMNVTLESSHREAMLDGQVMRFQIMCANSDSKGT